MIKKNLRKIGVVLIGAFFIYGISLFSRELKKNADIRTESERMQYLKDSLTVETLKKKLDEEKEDTCEYSNDRVVSEDMGLSPN